jgi:diguanylate cyclase (GGDEF)-like protein
MAFRADGAMRDRNHAVPAPPMPLPVFPQAPELAHPEREHDHPHGRSRGNDALAAATQTARRVVALAFTAAAVLAAGLTVERWHYHQHNATRVEAVKQAQHLADTILLHDERLTMSATLAAATGQPQWAERYAEFLPLIDQAIHDAASLVDPDAASRFDAATRHANDQLVAMEKLALSYAADGRLDAARSVLAWPAYAEHKRVLAEGTDRLLEDLRNHTEDAVAELKRDSWAFTFGGLLLFLLAFVVLRRHLGTHLHRVEGQLLAQQTEITHLALHDPLTGLANRRNLRLLMESAIGRAQRQQSSIAMLVLDLDGFKPINDRYGHPAGDAVLLQVAQRMRSLVRPGDVVARLGGDEFVVVLEATSGAADPGSGFDAAPDADTPLHTAQRLVTAISRPITLPMGDVAVSASVGVALYPMDGQDPDELLRRADVALYRAKDESRGEVRFFQPTMDEAVRERDALKMDLRIAIERQQIEPYFQPLINLATGALNGFEVLARWQHPTRGAITPLEFVKVAEDSGQIDALTVCVMRLALKAALHWDPKLSIAVNIAPQQLKNESLVERLLGVLAETGFPAERFEIEITENALIGDLELARRIVLALKSRGIRVALDDFGTGYSSLAHLSELPFDKIKIDRSFIHSLRQKHESATIVHAIIGLGKSLNLPTAAEGIESAADADLLAELGCHVGQGYHYSKPVPAHEVARLIDSIQVSPPATQVQGEDSAMMELV